MSTAPGSPTLSSSPDRPAVGVLRFSGFRRVVSDLDRSVAFYVDGLGFVAEHAVLADDVDVDVDVDADPSSPAAPPCAVRLTLGRESIELVAPAGGPRRQPDARPASVSDVAFHHLAIVTNDMDAALRRLARFAPTAISRGGPVHLPERAGGVTAFKFRDPDGHPLELIRFPPGAGDARWQSASAGAAASPMDTSGSGFGINPTLGIDHSAISVADVAQSLAFYVDGLGFRTVSRQTNRGAAQARLDGVPVSEVDVVGLAPSDVPTPHLELLGYHLPAPRRDVADAARLDDGHADRMTFLVEDLSALAARLDALPAMPMPARRWLGAHTLLLCDGDGHLLLLRQAPVPRPARRGI